jgi:hypothetical protein
LLTIYKGEDKLQTLELLKYWSKHYCLMSVNATMAS